MGRSPIPLQLSAARNRTRKLDSCRIRVKAPHFAASHKTIWGGFCENPPPVEDGEAVRRPRAAGNLVPAVLTVNDRAAELLKVGDRSQGASTLAAPRRTGRSRRTWRPLLSALGRPNLIGIDVPPIPLARLATRAKRARPGETPVVRGSKDPL